MFWFVSISSSSSSIQRYHQQYGSSTGNRTVPLPLHLVHCWLQTQLWTLPYAAVLWWYSSWSMYLGNEEEKMLVSDFAEWSGKNRLILNTSKTKEMDFRHQLPTALSICIMGEAVEVVPSYTYPALTLDYKLVWALNTDQIYKKSQNRLYFLQRLDSFNSCTKLDGAGVNGKSSGTSLSNRHWCTYYIIIIIVLLGFNSFIYLFFYFTLYLYNS